METLRIINLSKSLGEKLVLNNISLTFEKGKIYGIVGGNGSGKTMLFRAISGLVVADEGEILVDEVKKDRIIDSIGCVIENIDFIPYFSGKKNLKLLAMIKNRLNIEDIDKYLELVGLTNEANTKVRKYSMGMRQKLSLAQAFMEEPDLLLLDEPFNALDETSKLEVIEYLMSIKKDRIILLTSHNGDDINSICDIKYSLREGQVVQ